MTIGNRPPTVRADGRGLNDLRPVTFTLGVQKWAEGSCRIKVGDTEVLCAATIVDRVPPHRRGTAEVVIRVGHGDAAGVCARQQLPGVVVADAALAQLRQRCGFVDVYSVKRQPGFDTQHVPGIRAYRNCARRDKVSQHLRGNFVANE